MKLRTILLSSAISAGVALTAVIPLSLRAQQTAQSASGQAAQFQKIEDQWSAAVVNQNQFKLEDILAPSYTAITAGGEVISRNQRVARLFEKGTPQAVSLEQRVTSVRIIEDVAMVQGDYSERTTLNGVERAGRGVFTHIYRRANGNWRCIASEQTPLPMVSQESAAGPQKPKETEAKNRKGHGFHLPL